MMRQLTLVVSMFAIFGLVCGCEGNKNALSTDSGEMTIQEYEAMQAAEEAKIAESMKAPAK